MQAGGSFFLCIYECNEYRAEGEVHETRSDESATNTEPKARCMRREAMRVQRIPSRREFDIL